MRIPDRTVERLITYRRLLRQRVSAAEKVPSLGSIYSHDLAALARVSPAQVRRDIMEIGFSGSPSKGYVVNALIDRVNQTLDSPGGRKAALVGAGNLGRALLSYFGGRSFSIAVSAVFEVDPALIGRVIASVRCYDIREARDRIAEHGISIGILAVPADQAQPTADLLTEAGISAILSFAPTPLRVRPDVYVEQVDIIRALEKAAHFAKSLPAKEVN